MAKRSVEASEGADRSRARRDFDLEAYLGNPRVVPDSMPDLKRLTEIFYSRVESISSTLNLLKTSSNLEAHYFLLAHPDIFYTHKRVESSSLPPTLEALKLLVRSPMKELKGYLDLEGMDLCAVDLAVLTLSRRITEILPKKVCMFTHANLAERLFQILEKDPRGARELEVIREWLELLIDSDPEFDNAIYLDLARFGPQGPDLMARLIVRYSAIQLPFGPRYWSQVAEAEPITQAIREAKVVLELTRRDPSWFGVGFSEPIPETSLDMEVLQSLLTRMPELGLHPEVMRLTIPDFVQWSFSRASGGEPLGIPPTGHPNALLIGDFQGYRILQGGDEIARGPCDVFVHAVVPLSRLETVLRRIQPGPDNLIYRADQTLLNEAARNLPEDHIAKTSKKPWNTSIWNNAMYYILFLQETDRDRLFKVLTSTLSYIDLDLWAEWTQLMLQKSGIDVFDLANEVSRHLKPRDALLGLIKLFPSIDREDSRLDSDVLELFRKFQDVKRLQAELPAARGWFNRCMIDKTLHPYPNTVPEWMEKALRRIVYFDATLLERLIMNDLVNGTDLAKHAERPWIDICLDPDLDSLFESPIPGRTDEPRTLEETSTDLLLDMVQEVKNTELDSPGQLPNWGKFFQARETPAERVIRLIRASILGVSDKDTAESKGSARFIFTPMPQDPEAVQETCPVCEEEGVLVECDCGAACETCISRYVQEGECRCLYPTQCSGPPMTSGTEAAVRSSAMEFLRRGKLQGLPTPDQIQTFQDLGGWYPFEHEAPSEVPTRECPKCQVATERTGGCLLISCNCGHKWCWACLREAHTHFDCEGTTRDRSVLIREISITLLREAANTARMSLITVSGLIRTLEENPDRIARLIIDMGDTLNVIRRSVILFVRSAGKLSDEQLRSLYSVPIGSTDDMTEAWPW